jgi:hypothetical protein
MSRWFLALMLLIACLLYDPQATKRVVALIGGMLR